jgi:hypothetical protein
LNVHQLKNPKNIKKIIPQVKLKLINVLGNERIEIPKVILPTIIEAFHNGNLVTCKFSFSISFLASIVFL